MKKRGKFLPRILNAVDLETGMLPGVPLLELTGMNRVLVENHKGILKYNNDEICIRTKDGIICVSGSGLIIKYLSRERVVMSGKVHSVKLQEG